MRPAIPDDGVQAYVERQPNRARERVGGRIKEMIHRSSENISAREVEVPRLRVCNGFPEDFVR